MKAMRHGVLWGAAAIALFGCTKNEPAQAPRAEHAPAQVEILGKELFNERCRDCHVVEEKGGVVGPALTHVGGRRDRRFLEQVIREPAKAYPGTVMPSYDTFSKKQVDSLVDYLSGLK